MPWWPFSSRPAQGLGVRGEKCAARYLKSHGYRILLRNYSCSAGEIDLIALDGQTLVFVEVKSRSDECFARAESALTFTKRRRLSRAARCYIQQKHPHNWPARFDVIAVIMPADGSPLVRHTQNAFHPLA